MLPRTPGFFFASRHGLRFPAWANTRTAPANLLNSGFCFAYPDLEPALRHCPGRTTDVPTLA